jgi:hypothetical protein
MINKQGEAEKEGTQEDPSKRTDKGKSLHVSSVENQVISHEIANRNDTVIKAPHEITKVPYVCNKLKTKAIFKLSMTEVLPTTGPHNNKPATG